MRVLLATPPSLDRLSNLVPLAWGLRPVPRYALLAMTGHQGVYIKREAGSASA